MACILKKENFYHFRILNNKNNNNNNNNKRILHHKRKKQTISIIHYIYKYIRLYILGCYRLKNLMSKQIQEINKKKNRSQQVFFFIHFSVESLYKNG